MNSTHCSIKWVTGEKFKMKTLNSAVIFVNSDDQIDKTYIAVSGSALTALSKSCYSNLDVCELKYWQCKANNKKYVLK